jgi:CBS domain-containing protein
MTDDEFDPSEMSFGGGTAEVRTFMAESVVMVEPTATLREAARAMISSEVGTLVVGSVEQPEGVISERDLARALATGEDPDACTVADVESSKLVWCDVTATVAEVAIVMQEQYVRHVLIEDDGGLVGIVSARDLLGAYLV